MTPSINKSKSNNSSKFTFLSGASIYLIFNVFSAVMQFAAIPVFARLMSPEGFGVFGACMAAIAVLSPLISFGCGGFVGLPIFRGSEPRSYVITSLQFICTTSIAFCALAYTLPFDVISTFGIERSSLFVAIGISSTQAVNSIYLGVELAKQNSKKNAATNLLITALSISFGIIGLMMPNANWINRLIGVLLAQSTVMIWCLHSLRRDYKLNLMSLDISSFKHLFAYSLPLLPHFFAGPIFVNLDRLILLPKVGAYSTGIYAGALTMSTALETVFMSINSALVPHIASEINCKDQPLARKRLLGLTWQLAVSIVVLCVFTSVGFSLLSSTIFGPQYEGINQYILPLGIASCFSGFYYLFVNYLFLFERTGQISTLTISSALLKFFLMWIMVPLLGALGAAFAAAATNLFLCVGIIILSQRAYPILSSNQQLK